MNSAGKVLDWLPSAAPLRVTDADIVRATSIRLHRQGFQSTAKLRKAAVIRVSGLGGAGELRILISSLYQRSSVRRSPEMIQ